MKKPIFLKLFVSYLLLILALSGIILSYVFYAFSSHAVDTSKDHLGQLGLALQYQAKPLLERNDIDRLNAFVREAGADIHVRITVIDNRGVVLADSEHAARTMENHGNRPEVAAALQGSPESYIRYSTTLHHDMLYLAIPMKYGERSLAVMRLSIPIEYLDPLLDRVKKHTLEIALIIISSSLLVALLFSHIISTPIRELNKASKRLAGGDFKVRVVLKGNDEIRELSAGFNEMAEKIEKSFDELTSSKEDLESIISSMEEGLIVIDSQGKILLLNRGAEKVMDSGRTLGRHYWELIRSPGLNSLVDMADRNSVTGEIELNEKIYLCSVTPIRSGHARIIILHDITEIRRIEDIKKNLVVSVSHELRTPLTAIKGFTETLMEEHADLKYLEIIKRNTDRLINIVNDLLELSELEARDVQLTMEQVNLKTLIENVLAMFDQKLKAKGLKAAVEVNQQDTVVSGDAFRLEQLFINLIDNAVKYTEQGGITVAIDKSPDQAVIRISDTGIGIPKEHLNRIFERFYVVDKSRSRKLGGTGLGLAIVKHIVALHKGSIAVSGSPGSGTIFTVTFPVSA